MKRILSSILITTVLFTTFPSVVTADPVPATSSNEAKAARTTVLVNRLQEIKSIDVENLSREEKKQLRKEVKAIRKEMKVLDQKVYLSVGAIIIVLLLLILLLK